MITDKGLNFAKKWYSIEHIPLQQVKVYQLLIKMIWIGGKITINHAILLGHSKKIIAEARLNGYIKIVRRQDKLPYNIHKKISEMIGKAPQQIYA